MVKQDIINNLKKAKEFHSNYLWHIKKVVFIILITCSIHQNSTNFFWRNVKVNMQIICRWIRLFNKNIHYNFSYYLFILPIVMHLMIQASQKCPKTQKAQTSQNESIYNKEDETTNVDCSLVLCSTKQG